MLTAIPKKPLERNLLKQQCNSSLNVFSQELLGFKNAPHHREWYGLLDGTCYQSPNDGKVYSVPYGEKRKYNAWIMLEAPRSHAKSSCFSVVYPLREVCKNKNVRIVIVSYALSQSKSFLREITTQMERNENIKEVYGNMVPIMPEKWTQDEIIVDRDRTDLKDPTISATSTGGTVLSKRADIIICDDLLNKDNTRTPEQREKVKQWFWEVLFPVLEPGGRLIVVGTAWHTNDLYQELLGLNDFQVRKVYDAIVDEDKQQTLWPERWAWDDLMKLKRANRKAFELAYRNRIQAADDATFQIEWLNEAKRKGMHRKLIRQLEYSNWDLGKMSISMGVDPAISKKRDSDNSAIAVIGRMSNGIKIPLYLLRRKLSPAELRDSIKGIAARFNPDIIVVENNAYQEALRLDLVDQTDLPIVGYTTGGEKFDLDIGLNSLAVEFENGKWVLPYSSEDPYTIKMVDYLVDGMIAVDTGHTEDLLMATWMAANGFRQLMGGKNNDTVQVVGRVQRNRPRY